MASKYKHLRLRKTKMRLLELLESRAKSTSSDGMFVYGLPQWRIAILLGRAKRVTEEHMRDLTRMGVLLKTTSWPKNSGRYWIVKSSAEIRAGMAEDDAAIAKRKAEVLHRKHRKIYGLLSHDDDEGVISRVREAPARARADPARQGPISVHYKVTDGAMPVCENMTPDSDVDDSQPDDDLQQSVNTLDDALILLTGRVMADISEYAQYCVRDTIYRCGKDLVIAGLKWAVGLLADNPQRSLEGGLRRAVILASRGGLAANASGDETLQARSDMDELKDAFSA